jgi:hypothetical protein
VPRASCRGHGIAHCPSRFGESFQRRRSSSKQDVAIYELFACGLKLTPRTGRGSTGRSRTGLRVFPAGSTLITSRVSRLAERCAAAICPDVRSGGISGSARLALETTWRRLGRRFELTDLAFWAQSASMSASIATPRISSGVPGLDEVLQGGLPRGALLLIEGDHLLGDGRAPNDDCACSSSAATPRGDRNSGH